MKRNKQLLLCEAPKGSISKTKENNNKSRDQEKSEDRGIRKFKIGRHEIQEKERKFITFM